jgi:hypothetical protein
MHSMKTTVLTALIVSAAALPVCQALAQAFDSGSDGSMGALSALNNPTTLQVPPDGKFKFTTVYVGPGVELRFLRNALNTPVYLLATGDIILDNSSTIDVSAAFSAQGFAGGAGGPGGFDGGTPNGAGKGPGGGLPGTDDLSPGGSGSGTYAHAETGSSTTNNGAVYGSALLIPMVGGSGGGGNTGRGGGGGGGAIVLVSNTRIELRSGSGVRAAGGLALNTAGNNIGTAGGGSGGAVRLVAPVVTGNGVLFVRGRAQDNYGRVRVDTIDRTGMQLSVDPTAAGMIVGSFMSVFGPTNPRLDIIEAAGNSISEGTNSPISITLPFGSDTNRTIVVQARDFNTTVPIEVMLTPDTGAPKKFTAQIDNAAANPASVSVPVSFPINTPVTVQAWVR